MLAKLLLSLPMDLGKYDGAKDELLPVKLELKVELHGTVRSSSSGGLGRENLPTAYLPSSSRWYAAKGIGSKVPTPDEGRRTTIESESRCTDIEGVAGTEWL